MSKITLGEIHNKRDIFTIHGALTLQEAAQKMAEAQVGALMVVDAGGTLIGIVSERDIVYRAVATQCNLCDTPVSQVMTKKVCVGDPSEEYQTGMARMQDVGCRHLPLVKDGKPVGMVSMRDLVAHDLSQCQFDVEQLEKYITS
jgi:signal-transduction protein with cAMP-binding, CBS, and nucleotidyltransferase domain